MRVGVSGDMIKSTAVLRLLFVILCAALIFMLLWCSYRSVLWKLIGLYTVYVYIYTYIHCTYVRTYIHTYIDTYTSTQVFLGFPVSMSKC